MVYRISFYARFINLFDFLYYYILLKRDAMDIPIIGLGMLGLLPVHVLRLGNDVICADNDPPR
jgi:hypothetical protein